ncbi:MAG: alpha/beta hydrolase [Ilumatobacteraceae bacterium]
MASANVNGITIEYETEGSGEPLLLVMGLGEQLTSWPAEFVGLLVDAGFQVIRFDNRDIGLSTEFEWEPPSAARAVAQTMVRRPPKTGYHLADMAADAAALLDELAVGPAHVVGVSMGGMIAQTMAIEHPAHVRSLTSIMSNTGDRKYGKVAAKLLPKVARLGDNTRENAVERAVTINRLISGPGFDADERRSLAEHNLERSFRPDGVARQTAAIMASPDRTPGLGGVAAPTLVIHGLLDPLVKPSGGVATARAVPGSRLIMYPDMGHDLPRQRWPEIVDEIRRHANRPAG